MNEVTESQTQRAILEYLAAKHFFYERRNSRVVDVAGRGGKTRPMFFGQKGMADIMVILPSHLPLWIEVKSPTGKQRPAQAEFQKRVESHGHVYMVVRDVNEVINFIDGIY